MKAGPVTTHTELFAFSKKYFSEERKGQKKILNTPELADCATEIKSDM